MERECIQNCNKDAVKVSTWKSEEIDITIRVVRMGGGWNWHGANPINPKTPN